MNVFDTAGAHTICDLVASRIRKDGADDSVFRERAVALTGTVVPALVWLRDNKGISLNIEVIRLSIELRWIWRLAMERHFAMRDPETGIETVIDSEGIPEDIIWSLKTYLDALPGYDPAKPLDQQRDQQPTKQHAFAQWYFTAAFPMPDEVTQ
jgi:intracellular multiplication protein IcmO